MTVKLRQLLHLHPNGAGISCGGIERRFLAREDDHPEVALESKGEHFRPFNAKLDPAVFYSGNRGLRNTRQLR